ncbi:MAG TPA: helicase C-terminal domain-containing protein [Nitrososphaerales archaeon]|nr:helicase C-terminal domain-containing protein [Nitrososphaerales archaeon]
MARQEPPRRALADDFPFKRMRPSQKEVLDQVQQAIDQSKKFIILEAPVGFGKSAIAAALSRHLGTAYLLTSTKQLQEQYSVDFGFPVVMGKGNFTCLVPTSSGKFPPCSKGRCEADWNLSECPHYLTFEEYDEHMRGACLRGAKCNHLKDKMLCHYYHQKWDAFRAPITVANYSFFLTEIRHTDDIRPRRLLVCDEAHDLERQMVGSASFSLRRSMLETYAVDGGPERTPRFIPDMGIEDPIAWKGPMNEVKGKLKQFLDQNLKDAAMQDRVTSCRGNLDSLEAFTRDLESHPSNWIVDDIRKSTILNGGEEVPSVEEVVFKPYEVGQYTSDLFGMADTVLLMSATIFSKQVFCKNLGIPEEEAAFVRIGESSFPEENRLIYAVNAAQLSKSTMDASLGTIARAVDEIMTRHSGERGIIHTTSYQQARYIMEHVSELNRKRLSSTENVSSRSSLLKAHGTTDESVLISPSLYQGVDLKDELSRFQVLVKVPYPDLSERRTRMKLERDHAWYDWQTALRLVQTYGRSVRSETDHAVTYILDSNFTRFLGGHRDLFPEYFLEALRVA